MVLLVAVCAIYVAGVIALAVVMNRARREARRLAREHGRYIIERSLARRRGTPPPPPPHIIKLERRA